MLALSHQYSKSFHKRKPSTEVNWKEGLEKVLEDPVGLENFTEFLKREFSAENIMFWMLCEHYRSQTDKQVRKKLAQEIVEHHVCLGAPDPINIDSHTRQTTMDGVKDADLDLFLPAQKQIFNLMKFDCYQRFLKSDLCESPDEIRKSKPLLEVDLKSPKKNRSRSKSRDRNRLIKATKLNLTCSNRDNDNQNNSGASTGDENSPKDELEEKKRKSLLPWQKGRAKNSDTERSNSRSPVLRVRTSNFRRSKRKTKDKLSSAADRDRSSSRTATENSDMKESFTNKILLDDATDVPSDYCRVNLPDLSSAVLLANSEETVGQVICNLLEKRGLPEMAVEAHLKDSNTKIPLDKKFSLFGGQEIMVGSTILIRLELPFKKEIAVKSSPKKRCFDVLEPVLRRYGLDVWNVTLQYGNTDVPVNLNGPICAADKCKIIVRKNNLTKVPKSQTNLRIEVPKPKDNSERNVASLVFDELIKGRGMHIFDDLGIVDLENNKQAYALCFSDSFHKDEVVVRRNSSSLNREKAVSLIRYSNRSSSIYDTGEAKTSLSDKETVNETSSSGSSLPRKFTHRDSCDISRVWNRVQKRFDDQRGTELNCELPDFLRIKKESNASNSILSNL